MKLFGSIIFFASPPFFIFVLCVALYFWMPVFEQFQPEKVNRLTLIRIMQLRDFRTFSAERIEKTADRCNAEFGRTSPNPPVFHFSPAEKNIYAYFEKQHRKEGNSFIKKKSYFENNLLLMVRSIYFRRMKQFDGAKPEERQRILTESADDLKHWQNVYFDFVRAAGLPMPSLAELLKEYDDMVEEFKTGASEDEIRQITAFKKNLNLAVIRKEIQKIDIKGLPSFFGNFLKPEKK